eukprot:m.233356 g.233356  ORF g.233356 m.233356 type:complete len:54 (+) comp40087_c0_seq7:3089-3250(+)
MTTTIVNINKFTSPHTENNVTALEYKVPASIPTRSLPENVGHDGNFLFAYPFS